MTEVLRLLVVDDHPMYRSGLRTVLEDDPALAVVAEAADGATAVRLTLDLQPDVVVMDLKMPGISGVEASRRICAEFPDTVVFLYSS